MSTDTVAILGFVAAVFADAACALRLGMAMPLGVTGFGYWVGFRRAQAGRPDLDSDG